MSGPHEEGGYDVYAAPTEALNLGSPQELKDPASQQYGYPPDEDAVGGRSPRITLPERTSAWARAVDGFMDGEVRDGPWTARKFALTADGGFSAYRGVLRALEVLGTPYVATTWRVREADPVWALVTWGDLYGLGVDVLCDEITAMYG